MQKKGIAFNMLILMGLALLVAVIIFFIMAKGSAVYNKSTSCQSAGGECVGNTKCEGKQSFLKGCNKNEICCINKEGINP